MNPRYNDTQRQFWATLEKKVEVCTIEFKHTTGGSRYLVNGFKDREFSVDGVAQTFQGVSMKYPDQPDEESGLSRFQIKFGRIGSHFRAWLTLVDQDPMSPIQAIVRFYYLGEQNPTRQYNLFVDRSGIKMTRFDVTTTLSYSNPMLLQNQYFYNPSGYWTGLK